MAARARGVGLVSARHLSAMPMAFRARRRNNLSGCATCLRRVAAIQFAPPPEEW